MPNEKEQEKYFWDQWAKTYSQNYDAKFVSYVHNFILRYCSKGPSQRQILEIGCGSISFFIAEDAAKIIGLDISRNQLIRYPHTAVLGDMTKFVMDTKFDIILFPASLHHCPKKYKIILSNACSYLNNKGILGLIEPNLFHPYRLALKLKLIKSISPGEEPLSPLGINHFLTQHQKMEKRHFEYCSLFPPSASKLMRVQRVVLERLEYYKFLHPLIYPWFFGIYKKL